MFEGLQELVKLGHKTKIVEVSKGVFITIKTLSHSETTEATNEATKTGGNMFTIISETLERCITAVGNEEVKTPEHRKEIRKMLDKCSPEVSGKIYNAFLELTKEVNEMLRDDETGETLGNSTTQY